MNDEYDFSKMKGQKNPYTSNVETPLDRFSKSEQQTILSCLIAAVDGPFFKRHEGLLHTLIGLDEVEIRALIKEWPKDPANEDLELAINNVLLHLIGYPHRQYDVWFDWLDVPPDEIKRLFEKWRSWALF